MGNRRLVLLSIILLLLSGIVVAIEYFFGVKNDCSVTFKSESSVLRVEIIDPDKFRKFTETYLKCERGNYIVGNPLTKAGPYKIRTVDVEITDRKLANKITITGDREISDISWETSVSPDTNSAIIYLQFSYDVSRNPQIESTVSFMIASQLRALSKWDDNEIYGTKLWSPPEDLVFYDKGLNVKTL